MVASAATPKCTIHTVELKLGVALIARTDLRFDQKERKILSTLKTSFFSLNHL